MVAIRRWTCFVLAVVYLLASCAVGNASSAIDSAMSTASYNHLLAQLVRELSSEKGTYGVYLMDLKSDQTCGINHREPFHAASTFKLPLNLYLYEQIAAGKIDPLSRLTYLQKHYEGGTGILQYKPVGSTYSIAELSLYSIVYSDNVATNILLSYLGRINVKNYMRSLGGGVVDDDRNITCPEDMAKYMLRLLDFADQYPEYGTLLIGYLENTVFNERLPQPLPEGVKVAHKIGNWPNTGTYNDVGYVKHPENPYIIAVFSKNTESRERAFQIIRNISKLVYNYQSNLYHIRILLNEKELNTEVPPLLEKGRILVPLRNIAEPLGAEVSWDGASKTAAINRAGKYVTVQIGSEAAVVNGRETMLSVPASLFCGRTMVPLRFVSEAFGARVEWDGENRLVSIWLADEVPQETSGGQVKPLTEPTPTPAEG
ncbi:MAG: serine hydrolase [Bacillota bacterium]